MKLKSNIFFKEQLRDGSESARSSFRRQIFAIGTEDTTEKLEAEITKVKDENTNLMEEVKLIKDIIEKKFKIKMHLNSDEERNLRTIRSSSFHINLQKKTSNYKQASKAKTDDNALENVMTVVNREIEQLATKEMFWIVQESIKSLKQLVNAKCDNKRVLALEENVKEFMKSEAEKFEDLKATQELFYRKHTESENKLDDEINSNKEIVKKTLDLMNNLKDTVDKISERPEEYAKGSEVTELKHTVT